MVDILRVLPNLFSPKGCPEPKRGEKHCCIVLKIVVTCRFNMSTTRCYIFEVITLVSRVALGDFGLARLGYNYSKQLNFIGLNKCFRKPLAFFIFLAKNQALMTSFLTFWGRISFIFDSCKPLFPRKPYSLWSILPCPIMTNNDIIFEPILRSLKRGKPVLYFTSALL